MEDIIPYRVLLTEIPLSLSCEEFYDYLRAHTSDRGIYNALLLTPQQTAPESSPNPIEEAGQQSFSLTHKQFKVHQRNIGAAYVDFFNRCYAEAAIRIPFLIGSAQIKWKHIGRVYESTSSHSSSILSTSGFQDRFRHAARQGRTGYLTWRRNIDRASNNEVEKRRKTEHEPTPISSEVATVFISLVKTKNQHNSDSYPTCQSINTENLFYLLQTTFQQLNLGFIHSIDRIAWDEIILSTDTDTAHALESQKYLEIPVPHSRSDKGQEDTTELPSHHVVTWRVSPLPLEKKNLARTLLLFNQEKPIASTSPRENVNITLARKEEVVTIIAKLFESTSGKFIGSKDKYGNYLFSPGSCSA